jgi:hypothetical protein
MGNSHVSCTPHQVARGTTQNLSVARWDRTLGWLTSELRWFCAPKFAKRSAHMSFKGILVVPSKRFLSLGITSCRLTRCSRPLYPPKDQSDFSSQQLLSLWARGLDSTCVWRRSTQNGSLFPLRPSILLRLRASTMFTSKSPPASVGSCVWRR